MCSAARCFQNKPNGLLLNLGDINLYAQSGIKLNLVPFLGKSYFLLLKKPWYLFAQKIWQHCPRGRRRKGGREGGEGGEIDMRLPLCGKVCGNFV